jgi:glycosyltransferase involved in cell wall biosynthesis
MKKVTVSVTSDLTTDQRVERVCNTLYNRGYQVWLIGRQLSDSKPISRPYPVHRMKLIFNRKFIFYAEFNFRLFLLLLFTKSDILLANDIDTLPANYLASKLRRKRLVLDIHEFFPETPEVYTRNRVKKIWLTVEKWFIHGIDAGYTVSGSIAGIYHDQYGLSLELIRNVPLNIKSPGRFGNENDVPFILYQGSLNLGRGIDLIIKSLVHIGTVRFYIAGAGPEMPQLTRLVKSLNLENRVFFLGKMHPSQLKTITMQASVGISMEEPMGLSYKYSLPNKLFDYIQARVPVLVSDLPEMKSIVTSYKLGLVAHDRSPENIASLLHLLLYDRELKRIWRINLDQAAEILCWEKESLKLESIFP